VESDVLSRQGGSWEELSQMRFSTLVLSLNPFKVSGLDDVPHRAFEEF